MIEGRRSLPLKMIEDRGPSSPKTHMNEDRALDRDPLSQYSMMMCHSKLGVPRSWTVHRDILLTSSNRTDPWIEEPGPTSTQISTPT